MQAILKTIDGISEWTGRCANWLVLIVTALIIFEVISRRFFGHPHIWTHEMIVFFYAAHFMLLGAFTLLHRGHVAVDIVYLRFSPRGQAILDVLAYSMFFFPFLIILMLVSMDFAKTSWAIQEVTPGARLPYIVPLMKTIVSVTALLLILQGLANFTRNIYFVVKGEPLAKA